MPLWSLGRALAWIGWRDPKAHPWRRDLSDGPPDYGHPYSWDDLAHPDLTALIRVSSAALGGDRDDMIVMPLSTRRDDHSEAYPFTKLAIACAKGTVHATGRDADGVAHRILHAEWRGPAGLSDRWREIWLDETDMLRAFPAIDRSISIRKAQCRAWLIAEITAQPDYQPQPVAAYQKEAERKFGLGPWQFRAEWNEAKKTAGDPPGWGKVGRRKS